MRNPSHHQADAQWTHISSIVQRFIPNEPLSEQMSFMHRIHNRNTHFAASKITWIISDNSQLQMISEGQFLPFHLNKYNQPEVKQWHWGLALHLDLDLTFGPLQACTLLVLSPQLLHYMLLWHPCASNLVCGTLQSMARHTGTFCKGHIEISCISLPFPCSRHCSVNVVSHPLLLNNFFREMMLTEMPFRSKCQNSHTWIAICVIPVALLNRCQYNCGPESHMIVQLHIFLQMGKPLHTLLLHYHGLQGWLLTSAQQQVCIHHGHICQVENKFCGPQECFPVHIVTFQDLVPKVNCFDTVVVVQNGICTPVPLALTRTMHLGYGGLVDGWHKVKDLPVTNCHGKKFVVIAAPPTNEFGFGFDLFTHFTERNGPVFLVASYSATESCCPAQESCCQVWTWVEIISVQMVPLIQQAILVHHLYHCCRDHSCVLCVTHQWTLSKFEHGSVQDIIPFLYEWKHTFPLKFLGFFVHSLCSCRDLETQAVAKISLWHRIQFEVKFVRLVFVECSKPAHTMESASCLIKPKGMIWCQWWPEWILQSWNNVPDFG